MVVTARLLPNAIKVHVEYSKHNTCNTWCVTYTYMPYIESKYNTLLGDCVIVLH